jgi:polysaccharide biosynthesis transport protein
MTEEGPDLTRRTIPSPAKPLPAYPPEEGIELREYLRVLLRRKWLIAAVLVTAVSGTGAFTLTATPMYRGQALLLIERTGPNVIDIQSVEGEAVRLGSSKDYYTTQYEILASRKVASDALEQLGLRRVDAFMGTPGGPLRWLRRRLDGADGPQSADPEAPAEVVDAYLNQLSVEPVPDSRLVRLYFESADRELAERVLDAHARAYIHHGLKMRTAASSEAGSFLQGSIEELQRRVAEAQQALSDFRREHDIVSVDGRADVVIARLESMNQRLVEAQAERIAREADMKLVRERSYESLPAVLRSELIQTLKQELAPLEREYAALVPAVTPAYSGLRALSARIEEARSRIDREIDNIVDGIESDYLAVRTREEELRKRVDTEKGNALQLKDDAVHYALLQQNVDTAMKLYESVRQRQNETGMVADLAATNVSVIDAGHASRRPSSPRSRQELVLGALIGLVGGIGLALLLDVFDNRLRTPLAIETHLRLPSLGVVPDLGRLEAAPRRTARQLPAAAGASDPARALVTAQEPPEPMREAYRAIRTDILLSQAGKPPRTLLFSSATAGEGKTTTALNTAVVFAQLRVPVLLIDADLRKPRCHQLLKTHRDPGLTEALTGGPCELHTVHVLGHELGFLAAGTRAPDPTELLGSQRMRELLDELLERFQYVLIDGPPLASTSDSLVLSSFVDGVVLVADQQRTPRQALEKARSRLDFVHAKVLGVILNRADPSDDAY